MGGIVRRLNPFSGGGFFGGGGGGGAFSNIASLFNPGSLFGGDQQQRQSTCTSPHALPILSSPRSFGAGSLFTHISII